MSKKDSVDVPVAIDIFALNIYDKNKWKSG